MFQKQIKVIKNRKDLVFELLQFIFSNILIKYFSFQVGYQDFIRQFYFLLASNLNNPKLQFFSFCVGTQLKPISFRIWVINFRPSQNLYLMKLILLPLIFLLLATPALTQQIAASGAISVNTNPFQAGVIVPKIDNSYFVVDFNGISWNQEMSLATTIARAGHSTSEDKLTITSSIVSAVGLSFQLFLQYLVLVEFSNYEFTYINMTAPMVYTSSKQLLFDGVGSTIPYVFLSGFSKLIMLQCVIVLGNTGTFTYPLTFATGCPAANTEWITFYLMLMSNPLIPQCNQSLTDYRDPLNADWTVQKQSNFIYFFGFGGIYSNGILGKANLDTNVFEVSPGGDFSVSMIAIDTACFKEVKFPNLNTGLQVWQIALIAVGSVLFVALIGVIIFLVIRAKREREKAAEDLKNQTSYDMSGAALGIPNTLNPVTVHPQPKLSKNDFVPEDKVEWTKEELDEKFGAT